MLRPLLHRQCLSNLRVQTTIMAASFKGGVVLGADTRTSTGAYVANRVTNKLTQLAEKARSRRARADSALLQLRNDRPLSAMP